MKLRHAEQAPLILAGRLPSPRPGRSEDGAAAMRPAALSWLSQCHGTLLGCPPGLLDRDTGCQVAPANCWFTARELGGLMLEYARRTTDIKRLDMAITLLQQACEDGPVNDEMRLINCCQLASALCTRFDVCGCRVDLDAAICVLERVCPPHAGLTSEESRHYPRELYLLLARSLQRRFELTGALHDLDAAAEMTAIIHRR